MIELEIEALMHQCITYFQANCYTESRISKYRYLWRTGIVRYMSEHKVSIYTSSIGADFIATCDYEGTIRHQEREKIRSVQVLDDMLLLGYIRKRCFTLAHHELSGEIGLEMEKFIVHLTNLRRSKKTTSDYRLYLSESLPISIFMRSSISAR